MFLCLVRKSVGKQALPSSTNITDTAKYCREMEASIQLATQHKPLPIHCSRGAAANLQTECRHTSQTKKQVTSESCLPQLRCIQTVILNPSSWLSREPTRRKRNNNMLFARKEPHEHFTHNKNNVDYKLEHRSV